MKDFGGRIRGWLRSGGALVMLAYVICHLGNHMLLLVSIATATEGHHYLIDPWRSLPGTVLLAGGFVAHYSNALWSIYVRRSFRLSRWGWWQLGLGLCIPLLIAVHLSSTRLIEPFSGLAGDYPGVLLRQWVLAPWKGVLQVVMLSVVWSHAAIGIHFWWRTKSWYPRWRVALAVFALLWPTLALAGYVAGGSVMVRAAREAGYLKAEMQAARIGPATAAVADEIALATIFGHLFLIGSAFTARAVRQRIERSRRTPILTHSNGRTVPIYPGATILETLVENHIPHASVCGGRARCTTCRVRILKGRDALPLPSALEARALERIGAPADLRLACQTRPTADIAIVPLLPPAASPEQGHSHAGFAGHEQFVTVMFVDLRSSTKLGEAKLPFDMLFLLDTFFGEMAAALENAGGHFSQFTGDGLMALFGHDHGDAARGAREALACASDMLARLARLNERLLPDLAQPLRMGIGIHQGEAIVGPLGPPGSQILTAIGDTVNTTARLEGLSKKHEDAVIVSRRTADAVAMDTKGLTVLVAELAGRAEPVEYYAVTLKP